MISVYILRVTRAAPDSGVIRPGVTYGNATAVEYFQNCLTARWRPTIPAPATSGFPVRFPHPVVVTRGPCLVNVTTTAVEITRLIITRNASGENTPKSSLRAMTHNILGKINVKTISFWTTPACYVQNDDIATFQKPTNVLDFNTFLYSLKLRGHRRIKYATESRKLSNVFFFLLTGWFFFIII